MVSCTDALCSDVYAAGWELPLYPVCCWEPSASFLKDPCFHMLLTPPAGNWAPHYTANMHLSQSTLGFTPSLPSGTEDPAKDLMRFRTVLIYLPESMGYPTYCCFPQLTCCPLHMLSQRDPAVFGEQWGQHGRWLFHLPAVWGAELSRSPASQEPCLALHHTAVVVWIWRISIAWKRGKKSLIFIVSQEKMHFSCRMPDCLSLQT